MFGKVFQFLVLQLAICQDINGVQELLQIFAMNHNALKWIMKTPVTIVNVAMEPQTFKAKE